MTKEYICIVCPNSCRVTVADEGDELVITGNTCKRGEDFARAEHTNPTRMLTTTVKLEGGDIRRLPVISSKEVPKDRLMDCLKAVYATTAVAPVARGEVIVANVLGLGVDVVAAAGAPRVSDEL